MGPARRTLSALQEPERALAVEAVRGELVSTRISLFQGNLQGIRELMSCEIELEGPINGRFKSKLPLIT